MKRIFILVALIAFLTLFFSVFSPKVSSEDIGISELAEEYGVNGISEGLPDDVGRFLEKNGIAPADPDSVMKLTPKTVLGYMAEKLKAGSAAPVRMLGLMLSVVVLSAASGAAADCISGRTEQLYRIMTVLTAVASVVPTIEICIDNAVSTLASGSDFLLCYVPVFAGISAASGNAASSASYNAIILIIAEAAVKLSSSVIMPVISVCMAMNIIDAINPSFSLSSVTGLMKKVTKLFMGFVMTVFTGLLSIQSIVGASADTVAIKAAKFMVSNFVPIVGNAVADAYSTMRTGLGLLKGAAGAFGVIALGVILLPPVIETCALYLAMTVGEAAAEVFGLKQLKIFFGGTASLLSLVIALLSCFGVMFVVSTIILMAAGMGAAAA